MNNDIPLLEIIDELDCENKRLKREVNALLFLLHEKHLQEWS